MHTMLFQILIDTIFLLTTHYFPSKLESSVFVRLPDFDSDDIWCIIGMMEKIFKVCLFQKMRFQANH